jgi:Fe-S cluster biogenesis protein NfuA
MSTDKKVLELKVLEALLKLKPYLEADGGDMELVEITDDNVVRVRLLGACSTCSMSMMTMKAGLEESIRKVAPEINRVEAVEIDLAHAE